ncbi:MAG: glycosyltransferase family 4 protein [Candidatus Margulisbacteria bacterium]|nr:glycosyltransferase family 4 protein [Candidatus Margulisiibacteriota bacterium]MBU1617355.1 glycosyltransferase family 4 protein [Candidatus Margulisiibacteriota bacterium]
MKKALFLCPSYYPFAGGEKYYQKVAEGVAASGYEVTVWTPKRDPAHPAVEVVGGVRIERFPENGLFGIWIFFLKNIRKILAAHLVHGFDYNTVLLWYLPFRLLFFRKPVFVTFLGHEGLFPVPESIILRRKLVELITWGNICGGHYIAKWYGTEPDFVVYGGCERPTKEIDPPGEPSAVFVGRIQQDTGLWEYLEALSILKEKYDFQLKLDIYGVVKDQELMKKIDSFIKERGLPVKYLGVAKEVETVIQEHKYAFLSACLANLEAMACRRLVFSIYSNPLKKDYLEMVPGAKEMNEICGIPVELAERIAFHLKNPQAAQSMLERAYMYALTQTWPAAAEKHRLLFEKPRPRFRLAAIIGTLFKIVRSRL